MKKMLILVAAAALLVAGPLFANEAVLIDIGLLGADMSVSENGDNTPNQNQATLMDFSNSKHAGSMTPEQRSFMRTSLAIENWEIDLPPSARTILNRSRSFTREAASERFGLVMGVRVHFPLEPVHARALIRPPFEIPVYEPAADVAADGTITPNANGDGTRFENGFGVVQNVGAIKALAVNVFGMNFPHSFAVVLLDNNGGRRVIPMGSLQFEGWSEVRWDNPAYIQEVRNRDLRIVPLYPDAVPFVKFGGFEIRRDGAERGGDFIAYFKDVKMLYDLAVLDPNGDIDDEAVWGIIQQRETARRMAEMERFGQNQVLRHLEAQRQNTVEEFTPTPGN